MKEKEVDLGLEEKPNGGKKRITSETKTTNTRKKLYFVCALQYITNLITNKFEKSN